MSSDIRCDADAMADRLVEWRRDFHRHPELGFSERRTSGIIQAFLAGLGLDVRPCAGTGLRAILRGTGRGPTIALRADMDALSVAEENECEYRSQVPGVMHACGHDGHMAILMGVAELLAARRQSLAGDVVFLFQPAEEEHPGGAARMIEAGALDGVDRIFGLHLWQPLPTGVLGTRAGALMAQSDRFVLTVQGKGGHASQPHLAIDPVLASAHVVTAAQSIASRFVDPLAPVVVTFATIHGGVVPNIIPDSVTLSGTVRTMDAAVQEAVRRHLGEVCDQTCRAFGARADLDYRDGYPPVTNDEQAVQLVRRAAARALGEERVREIAPVMAGEDFARYLQRVPGAFMLLGAGDGQLYPHHNPRFDIDERVLPLGVALMSSVVLESFTAAGE